MSKAEDLLEQLREEQSRKPVTDPEFLLQYINVLDQEILMLQSSLRQRIKTHDDWQASADRQEHRLEQQIKELKAQVESQQATIRRMDAARRGAV